MKAMNGLEKVRASGSQLIYNPCDSAFICGSGSSILS